MGRVVLMKGTVIDKEGHVLYRFDNGFDYSTILTDGETIQSYNYIDENPIPLPEVV